MPADTLTLREKALYHQIHRWKLAIDIGCELVSLYLLWQHKLIPGLFTHFVPPIVASLLLIRFASLEAQRSSAVGERVRWFMTRRMEAVRLLGDIVMMIAAWQRSSVGIVLGLAIVIAAWCNVLLRRPPAERANEVVFSN